MLIGNRLRRYSMVTWVLEVEQPCPGPGTLFGLDHDGDVFWTYENTTRVLQRRSFAAFSIIIETIPSPVAWATIHHIQRDHQTGYLWFQQATADSLIVCIWNPITRTIVEPIFHWTPAEYPMIQRAIDHYGLNYPEEVVILDVVGFVSGNIKLNYMLYDIDGMRFDMTAREFSIDAGVTWRLATSGPGGDGTTNLEASGVGTAHTWYWDSNTDVGAVDVSAKVRLTFRQA